MDLTALIVLGDAHQAASQFAEDTATSGLVFNGFWILIAAVNFIFFLIVLQQFAFGPVSKMLAQRRQRIEQGLRDADVARQERQTAAAEKQALLHDAHREANDIVARAQKAADDVRERDVAATRDEIERLRQQAAAEIAAERQRALAEARGQIADLALLAAGRVVGETRTSDRERRLVDEFLTTVGPSGTTGQA